MPLIDADAYVPREGEPEMMSLEQRAAAALAYHKELAEAGEGRVIVFQDGRAWFVPNDLGACAADVELALTGKQGGFAGFVLAEAFKVIVENAQAAGPDVGAPTETAPPTPIDPVPSTDPVATALAALAGAMAEQTNLLRALVEKPSAPSPAPAPEPVEDVKARVLDELRDAGFDHQDANAPGVSRGPMAFVNLYNGARVSGTEPVVGMATPQEAVAATIAGVKRLANAAGATRIMWRMYPTMAKQPDGFVVRCRLLLAGDPASA